jgi:Tol biopolymer transport system component
MVLGTVAYMSPEQARGQDAGYRSDLFSFGLILYEMLGGKQAFARGSAVETMAAIVRDEPEPLEGKIPVPLKWLVDRCLEKDPTRRFDSTRDLYQQLRTMRDHFSEAYTSGVQALLPEVAQAGAKRKEFSVRTAIAMAALAAVLAGACAWWLHPSGVQLAKYKYTPFAVNAGSPLWSPDGKTAAYAGIVGDDRELFLRRLDSPMPQQLTSAPGFARPIGWSPDSSHIYYIERAPGADSGTVLSIASVGGEPDVLWTLPPMNMGIVAVSPDGKAGALYCINIVDPCDIEISDPIGSPLRAYPDSHVTAKNIFGTPQLKFSPDGKKLLLIRAGDTGADEAWLLPWPAGKGTPRQILKKLPHDAGTPIFSWMPDNRHIIVATASGNESSRHLFLADTKSDSLQQITQGTSIEDSPSVSPDGASILYAENHFDFDIVSMSLKDGTTQGMIVTPRMEAMPAWAARGDSLVYVSNRLGPEDIWQHTKDGQDRPLVTRASFASDPPKWMFAPVLSPDGSRVIFVTVARTGETWLWEVSVAGGAPVRLVNASDKSEAQFTGDWSPDGKQFAYMSLEPDGKSSLNVVRTSGGAVQQKIAEQMDGVVSWSPDGKWIAYSEFNFKWHLISPDGKQHRDLGIIKTPNLGFSKDGKTAYGIRNEGAKFYLFSLDMEMAKLHDIKQLDSSLQPRDPLGPAIRFTLAPDGKSFAYSIAKPESSIWMLQGFDGK